MKRGLRRLGGFLRRHRGGPPNCLGDEFAEGNMWAIEPHALQMVIDTAGRLENHISTITAGRELSNDLDALRIFDGGIAVIPVSGILTKRRTFLNAVLSLESYEQIGDQITAALEDSAVVGVVLDIDSPGGTVDGVTALADLIFEARNRKPIVAFADGIMASGAYWLSSAAQAVIVSQTAQVGSIGVLTIHRDISKALANEGVKISYLAAGRYKALGNPAEPLSDEARGVIEDRLSAIYGVFIDAVARNRGVTADQVRSDMADGRIFIGEKAVEAGLADQVGGIQDAVARLLQIKINENPLPAQRAGDRPQAALPAGSQPPAAAEKKRTLELKREEKMTTKNEDFMSLVKAHQIAYGCTMVEAMQAIMKSNPRAHAEYLQACNPGKTFIIEEGT